MLASQSNVLPTLASQPLPRHVRHLLKSALKNASVDLERSVGAAITDFEQLVVRELERASFGAALDRWKLVLTIIERARPDIVRNFLANLEAELANLQQPQVVRGQLQTRYQAGDVLALVDDHEIEETSALTDAATRAELQNSLPLFLLGQRFGVLAGRPAFDAETLPIGPQGLCRSIRHAVERLGLDVDVRLMFYRSFERQVMPHYGALVDVINTDLARSGVLEHLQYVPVRARRTEQKPAAAAGSEPLPNRTGNIGSLAARGETRGSADNGETAVGPAAARPPRGAPPVEDAVAILRELMASRRQLLGKLHPDRLRGGREATRVVSAADLQEVLRSLQAKANSPMLGHGRNTMRQVAHLKQDMLAMLRRTSHNEEAPALAEEHSDAIDVVGMLYDVLMKDVRPGSAASSLLSKLEVPLIRAALQDPAFPTLPEHPARQLLNSVAETGLRWLDEENSDPSLASQLHSIVDRVVHDYQGDSAVFRDVQQELQQHLQTLSRKADAAERRHVEAARGKEKLMLAREHAAECMEALLKDITLPRFTRTMLTQAWADVMALTSLRQGQDSPDWERQLEVGRRLIELAQRPADQVSESPTADLDLQREIEEGLAKVGYQGDDVSAIATRLVHPNSAQLDDAGSRTELTMRLKARARLGEDLSIIKERSIPLTSAEQVEMERIKEVPVGTWFEFTDTANAEKVRRRLSWLSTVTGDALFVNQRGQKNAEYTLPRLARLVAKGQVRIIEEEKGTVIDRCWEGVMAALRTFAVPVDGESTS